VDTVEHAEMVEKELDAFIERRSRKKDPDEESKAWKESVRRYEDQRRQMARVEWHAFHTEQAERHRAVLEDLITYHETRAQSLLTEGDL
jgi:hypothetical protein